MNVCIVLYLCLAPKLEFFRYCIKNNKFHVIPMSCRRINLKTSVFFFSQPHELLSPKLYVDVPAVCRKSDFLYIKGALDNISYPLFVHAIRENINGLGSYHTRLKAECDTNPNH